MDKPLFIPLKTEYYEAFKSGEKSTEIRRYGARWNRKTCFDGRPVVLSKGYGKKDRLTGVIKFADVREGAFLDDPTRKILEDIYGDFRQNFIFIHIKLDPHQ